MAFRRNFLCPMFGMALVLSVVAALLVGGVSTVAQPMPKAAASDETLTVNENTTFSWPIVVLIVTSAIGYGGVVWSVRQHHTDGHVHMTDQDIAKDFPRRAECAITHKALDDTLARIEASLGKIEAKVDALK